MEWSELLLRRTWAARRRPCLCVGQRSGWSNRECPARFSSPADHYPAEPFADYQLVPGSPFRLVSMIAATSVTGNGRRTPEMRT
jgi:hypothetical protein